MRCKALPLPIMRRPERSGRRLFAGEAALAAEVDVFWVDHFRIGDAALARRLDAAEVLTHPFVIGEIALGDRRQRTVILSTLAELPKAAAAKDAEVLRFIEVNRWFGRGIGYADSHLLGRLD